MSDEATVVQGTQSRIQDDIAVFYGLLPERYAAAWTGYIVALLEGGLIGPTGYEQLRAMLPPIAQSMPQWTHQISSLVLAGQPESSMEAILVERLERDLANSNGRVSELYAIAWDGYLAGLFEWVIFVSASSIPSRLPPIAKPDPVLTIYTGRIWGGDLRTFVERALADEDLPLEETAIAWRAYLGGLWEYGRLPPLDYEELLVLLPPVTPPNPIDRIGIHRGAMPRIVEEDVFSSLQARLSDIFQSKVQPWSRRDVIAWKAYVLSHWRMTMINRIQTGELISLLPLLQAPDPTLIIVDEIA